MLVLFGASAFFSYGLEPQQPCDPNYLRKWPRVMALIAATAGLIASLLWLMSEAAMLSGEPAAALRASAVWSVITDTHFGQIGAYRSLLLGLNVLALATLKFRWQSAWVLNSLLAAVVVASLAWTGHGNFDSGIPGWMHLGSDLLHLLSAGLWVGALVVLCWLCLRAARRGAVTVDRELAYGIARFSGIGVAVVAVLVLSGIVNSWFLIGPVAWRAAFTTLYGQLLLIKIGLFALMLALAAINRLRLVPKLQRAALASEGHATWQALRATLIAETALAMLVLGLVAVIGTLEPPISVG
jgi:putative copper resistance protein D